MFVSVLLTVVVLCTSYFFAFNAPRSIIKKPFSIRMEYIPDGLTKAQWEAMKKKEMEANKGKDLSTVGITKFKSRSFEAWQKTGQQHLFPVDPKTPTDQKPYMQRQGGSYDGEDLKKIGIQGKDQAKASAKTEIDKKYEQLEKEGKLKSSPFSIPWTSEAAQKLAIENAQKKKAAATPSSLTVATNKKLNSKEAPVPEPKKKLFGLF